MRTELAAALLICYLHFISARLQHLGLENLNFPGRVQLISHVVLDSGQEYQLVAEAYLVVTPCMHRCSRYIVKPIPLRSEALCVLV